METEGGKRVYSCRAPRLVRNAGAQGPRTACHKPQNRVCKGLGALADPKSFKGLAPAGARRFLSYIFSTYIHIYIIFYANMYIHIYT